MLSKLTENKQGGIDRISTTHPWSFDIEVGSLATFFSADKPTRGAVTVSQVAVTSTADARVLTYAVRYPDASLRITEREQANARTLKIEALEDSLLMDAVIRFVLPLSEVNTVALNENIIEWKRQNKYHQVEGATAQVRLKDGRILRLRPHCERQGLPAGLAPMTYLRDEPEAWILHVRLRANQPTHFSTRGCVKGYNKPFPQWAQALFKAIPGFHRATFLIRERLSQRIPFQTNGAVQLKKGEAIEFGVTWETI